MSQLQGLITQTQYERATIMAATSKPSPKQTFLAMLVALTAGLKSKPPGGVKSFSILTEILTLVQLLARVAGIQLTEQKVVDLRTSLKAAIKDAKAVRPANRAFITALRKALIYLYGTDTAGLVGCGIVVKQRAPLSTHAKAVASARATATRQTNGTGKKAKPPLPTVTVTEVDGTVLGQAPVTKATPATPGANAPPEVPAAAPAVGAAAK